MFFRNYYKTDKLGEIEGRENGKGERGGGGRNTYPDKSTSGKIVTKINKIWKEKMSKSKPFFK